MNQIPPLISVIVPIYKVEKYLRTCIESVLAQTYEKWELILVDDGSPDECPAMCDEYSTKDNRICVIHKKNGGLSSARNAGLDLPPQGEFVTFLDSDDFWHPEYLKTLMELAQTHEADLVQCDFVRGIATAFPELEAKKFSVSTFDNHSIFVSEKAKIIMCGKLFKTCLFDNIRMPVGLYNEDDWTAWKLYYRAKTIVVTNQPLYYYTVNPTSIMARLGKKPDLRFVNAYDERINFFRQTSETDLEHCSHLQLCKALLLAYSNPNMEKQEKVIVQQRFNESWQCIKRSPFIRKKYKLLFTTFSIAPQWVSSFTRKIR